MKESDSKKSNGNYTKFVIMLSASFVAMYVTMFLNTYQIDHVYFSLTRFYMTCLGISAMSLIMFFMMRKMYKNRRKNRFIVVGSILLFAIALSLVRIQRPIIKDRLWMEAMIPHHSIAILTSKRADIQDPEAKKLANDIIKTQEREIAEMKSILKRLKKEKEKR